MEERACADERSMCISRADKAAHYRGAPTTLKTQSRLCATVVPLVAKQTGTAAGQLLKMGLGVGLWQKHAVILKKKEDVWESIY